MEQEKIEEIIEKFQSSFDKYHKLFLESYPLFSRKEYDYGSRDLNSLGIECQAYMSMLGTTAKARMNYIGFRQFFAFDNAVDWYNWKIWIKENEVDLTQYLSISIRIDTELKRMQFFLQKNMWSAYCDLKEDEYSISYLRYEDFKSNNLISENSPSDHIDHDINMPNIHLVINNHPEKIEEQVFSNIEHIEKKTSIMANIATFIARVSGLKI